MLSLTEIQFQKRKIEKRLVSNELFHSDDVQVK